MNFYESFAWGIVTSLLESTLKNTQSKKSQDLLPRLVSLRALCDKLIAKLGG